MNGQNIQTANEFPSAGYEMEWDDKDVPKEYENYDPNQIPLPEEEATKSFSTEDLPETIKRDAFLDGLQEALEKLNEMYEDLFKRQTVLDEKIEKFFKNENKQTEQRSRILENLEDNAKITALNEQEDSLALLPFFNAVAQNHIGKIENLERKRAKKADRLSKRTAERDDCLDRIDRLNDTNVMLEKVMQYLPNSAPQFVISLCEKVSVRNNEKIERLQKEYLPKAEKKIKQCESAVKKLDERIAYSECKLERCSAMSGVIKSFAILNSSERKELFAKSIASLHDSTLRLNEMKIDRANAKLDKLCERLDNAETYSERYEIKAKQDKLYTKIKALNKLSETLKNADHSEDTNDESIAEAKKETLSAAAKENSIGKIEDKVIKKVSEKPETQAKQVAKVQNAVRNVPENVPKRR